MSTLLSPGLALASLALVRLASPASPAAAAPAEPLTRSLDLPAPRTSGAVPIEKTLADRRSVRDFAATPLALAEVGQLLWAAQGTNRPDGRRTAPSAGATYPLELWLVAGAVDGLQAGLYRYQPSGHRLLPIDSRDRRKALATAAHDQQWVAAAPAVVVVAAAPARTAARYGERAERYVAIGRPGGREPGAPGGRPRARQRPGRRLLRPRGRALARPPARRASVSAAARRPPALSPAEKPATTISGPQPGHPGRPRPATRRSTRHR